MLDRLIPRDQEFFRSFDQLAEHLVRTAQLLEALFAHPEAVADHVRQIKDEEHKADLLTASINQRIDKTFITPIDREDIHTLASRLDDVVDLIDGTARRFEMLHVKTVLPPAREICGVLTKAAAEIQRAVGSIRTRSAVNAHYAEIKRLEEEGDAIYHEAVGSLFSGSPDPIEVIKWMEMYDTLERAVDSCMGVAQVLSSISLKNA